MSLLNTILRQLRFGQVVVANGEVHQDLEGTSQPRRQNTRLPDTVAYVLKTPEAVIRYERNPDNFDLEKAVEKGQALKFERRDDIIDVNEWEASRR